MQGPNKNPRLVFKEGYGSLTPSTPNWSNIANKEGKIATVPIRYKPDTAIQKDGHGETRRGVRAGRSHHRDHKGKLGGITLTKSKMERLEDIGFTWKIITNPQSFVGGKIRPVGV
jgi:hypothetical protein